MDTQKLRKNIKRLRRAKIKFKERIQKFYKKKIQEIDDEIYSTQLLIKSKEKNDKVIFSSKMTSQLKPYSPSPMKAKTRKKKGLINIDLKKIANVDGGLQRIRDSRYKPQPINRQAARAVGIYSKKKY
tara:strand:+ start:109 stop:492 length:384 start_codon:yes stop_codon:yes gene_type:complete